jgi:hypothetical protein
MKLIPIYDATVPITCSATRDEIPMRMEQVERMRSHLDRIERTEHGVLLHFPNRPDLEAELRRFTADEKGCCPFWGFAITTRPDTVTLRWDAPPALDDYVTRLVAFFESTDPLTPESGLF